MVDALQEIGAAAPVALDEGRLVDDFGAGAHGFFGGAGGGGEVPGVGAQGVYDLAALGVELFQVGGFVLFALAAEEVGVVFGDVGALTGAAGDFEGQRREVGALDVVVEVRGGEDEARARRLHRCALIVADRRSQSRPPVSLRSKAITFLAVMLWPVYWSAFCVT